jgi:glycosyltransferase involved in cell wall biosynthesis
VKKLCYVATIPAVVHAFLRPHILAAAGKYEVTVICNAVDTHLLEGINARFIFLPIERKPSPWRDALVLLKLIRLFHRERFDIVHTHMPKTGLLGMLAAWLARVPIRINTCHGEVWATRKGWRRALLKMLDRFTTLLATDTLLVSPSQRDFLLEEGVLPPGKARIIGAGSICGVDSARFHPDPQTRAAVRSELNIKAEQIVLLFVGRLNRDKGVLDLAAAFARLAEQHADLLLLLVGAEEDVPYSRIQQLCDDRRAQLRRITFTPAPERYMAAADIYCLPSYREGFGLTIIEAAACGLPAVASQIYGITDAVADGQTGLLFPAGDVALLTENLQRLVENHELRRLMGNAARARAQELYSSQEITNGMQALYDELLQRHKTHK